MSDNKTMKAKLWNEVSLLTSGVLTSIISGFLSGSSYYLEIDGKQYDVVSRGMNSWHACGLVMLIFLCLWTFFSVIMPWLSKVKKRFTYDKIRRIRPKDMINALNEAKATIEKLYPIFYQEYGIAINISENKAAESISDGVSTISPQMNSTLNKKERITLYSRELSNTILCLQRVFLPPNMQQRKNVKKYFRKCEHDTIVTANQKVSAYELKAMETLLKGMVSQMEQAADKGSLFAKDCKAMEKSLNELEELFN